MNVTSILLSINTSNMGEVLGILLSKKNHQDLLTVEFPPKYDQHWLHTRVTVLLISFLGLHVFSNIIVEPSMYQLDCEHVSDRVKTTTSKTAVELAEHRSKPAASGTSVVSMLSISLFLPPYDNIEGLNLVSVCIDGNGGKLQSIPQPFGTRHTSRIMGIALLDFGATVASILSPSL